MDVFTTAYIECALWACVDNDGESLDDAFSLCDIDKGTLAQMQSDCADFQESNAADLETLNSSQCGHDFWLTRNRHGAGFWDRGLGEVGARLTEMAHDYGSYDLYVGDDGKIYGC